MTEHLTRMEAPYNAALEYANVYVETKIPREESKAEPLLKYVAAKEKSRDPSESDSNSENTDNELDHMDGNKVCFHL